ncbi:hypothetical protein FRB95_008863 [Tulasnella sp. JGI-2019a]|nr:hypothetical protein FRB93_008565 [Tulasnella sp. JGI-2019a]KAG9026424.1 hypothetical protein FRB95_008863 [Tulasnella sp. JGI-2019a]
MIVTLWRPAGNTRPLSAIGWTIVAIYILTLGRIIVDYHVAKRTLFISSGNPGALDSMGYVFRGLQGPLHPIASSAGDYM